MTSPPEFNNGFVTALALFYGHSMDGIDKDGSNDYRVYVASDHLYDLEIPACISEDLRTRLKAWVDYVFSQKLERPSKAETSAIFEDCKKYLMEIDREVFGLTVEVVHS